MSTVRGASAIPFAVALVLGGCGTYVPEIQEFPATPLDGQQLVDNIAFNVTCEVRDAIIQLYHDYPQGTFLDSWGAQITLNLSTEEKSSVNPTGNWTPPSPASALFNLGFSATGSADATRIDKISWFLAVPDLRGKIPCGDRRPKGIFLLQSDLKLKEWLYDAVDMNNSRYVNLVSDTPDGPFKQNVLSHEVKFEVQTMGGLVPGWKLARVSINQSGTGLSATRDRTHDLTITFGPVAEQKTAVVDKKGNVKKNTKGQTIFVITYAPIGPATDAHLASEIGLAVANGIKSALPSP
jgi:hypothetical protein